MAVLRSKALLHMIWLSAVLHLPVFAQSPLDSLLKILPDTCTSLMQQRGWPSLSVAVVIDQDIVFSRAFGYADADNLTPATTQTIYRVGSITKLFGATMLLQLAERGKVSLDDQLRKYIPAYTPRYRPNSGPTTLRQLATHTAGLHVDAAQAFWHYLSNAQWIVSRGKEKIVWGVSKDDLLSGLDKVEIEYTPNLYPHYSNFGFQLLGIALERAAGEPYEQYITANILNPLGMHNSGFVLSDERKAHFAVGYTYLEPGFQRFRAPEWELDILKYSGGLYSTPEDMARFIALQFRDGATGHPDVLHGDGLRLMHTPQTLRSQESNDTYGIGWALYDDGGSRVIGHAGGHWGFFAKAEALPDLKLGVVIMTNCNYPQGNLGPEKDLTKIIYEMFVPVLRRRKPEPVQESWTFDPRMYCGRYALSGEYAHVDVSVRNDTLYFTFQEKPQFREAILHLDAERFCFAFDPKKTPLLRFATEDHHDAVSLEFLGFKFKKN